jgi:hypothetical protein
MYVNSMFRLRAAVTPTGLGQTSSTSVQVDSTDVLSLGDQLRSAQTRLTNLLGQMRTDSALAAAIGPDVTAQQAALSDLITKYVGAYTAVFGQPPVGLSGRHPIGLGNPILVAAAVAILITYVAAQLYLWYQKQQVLETQAQAQVLAEQNRSSIIDLASQTAAAGDTAGAIQMLNDAGIPGTTPPPQGLGDWLKANWIAVAAIGGAILIVPRFMDR